jgi:hypothetical protein
MRVFLDFALPGMVLIVAVLVGQWAKYLQFFSQTARCLVKVDIPNEVSEVRTDELEMLVCDEADFMFNYGWEEEVNRWQRRAAVTRRLRQSRKWLRLIIANATLFQEVARYCVRQPEPPANELEEQVDDLAHKVLDRGAEVHFMAVACLAKLALVDAVRFVWPIYRPLLADHFQVGGKDMILWYRHLAKEMIELAKIHTDDVTYTRFIFQLTGFFTAEEAEAINRI